VANEAHVCRRGKVAEKFEAVARDLYEGNVLPWNSNGKHCNYRNKLLLANFRRRTERAHWRVEQGRNLGNEISCSRISSPQSMTTKSVAGQSARNPLSATSI
jgi:hypothetical protein